MTRTQIQLPDDLYRRAKRIAAERELSLAEMTRRGLEIFLDRLSPAPNTKGSWRLPVVDGGDIKVPLEQLRNIVADEEMLRALHP